MTYTQLTRGLRCLSLSVFILLLIAFTLIVVSLSAVGWWETTVDDGAGGVVKFTVGLWKMCVYNGSVHEETCATIKRANTPDWFESTQGLVTVSMVLTGLALLYSVVNICLVKKYVILPLVIISFLATLFTSTAVVIFSIQVLTKSNLDDITGVTSRQVLPYYGFFITTLGGACTLLAACLASAEIASRRDKERYTWLHFGRTHRTRKSKKTTPPADEPAPDQQKNASSVGATESDLHSRVTPESDVHSDVTTEPVPSTSFVEP